MIGRVGLALAAVLLAGCGGDPKVEPAPEVPTEAPEISLADVCPKIQDALDDAYANGGDDNEGFVSAVDTLINDVGSDDKMLLVLLSMVSSERATATPDERLEVESAWLDVMRKVTDACQQAGAPLS